MAVTRTLTIIKPDGVEQNVAGEIIHAFEENQFKIVAIKMLHLSKQQAEGFYAVHRERPFFGSLTDFMSSGRVVVIVLEAENAIERLRKLMGATNPEQADSADRSESSAGEFGTRGVSFVGYSGIKYLTSGGLES